MNRMDEVNISKKTENIALKCLKKSFEDQFGSVCKFFEVKSEEKKLCQVPKLSEKIQDNVIKQNGNSEEFPEVINFIEKKAKSSKNTEFHSFMSSKLPNFYEKRKSIKEVDKRQDLDYKQLKNDIALQRLLRECHLLKKGSDSSTFSLEPVGKQRHKIIENRIKLLGGKEIKEKIPFKIRLGMKLKAKIRSDIAKKKAKESGLVRALPAPKSKAKHKRNYGLNEIRIGKYHKGMITLSEKDIRKTISTPVLNKKNKKRGNNRKFV
ncbi:hypothetical protein T552_02391 [Pneumocystis carinii B80]|uniref:Uncharacterized protein n=1 Tax=Pneumocystis carinii (strain B80) TaxID=1408658 RepID=A0A0W4ZGD3_PNEC8|nr:hypothetical protein T552_02391 [Pneumocystis carinii B80]KTW27412.1 hypothetical protein T552_02391 [Pneumocystis carinii B80]